MSGHFLTNAESASNAATFGNNVVGLRSPQRILLNEPHLEWSKEVHDRLNELATLGVGWDGYAAPPVSFVNASFALRMLEAICQIDAPPPQIVPGTAGDLQIEWHTNQGDIELHVQAPYDVQAWRANRITGEEGEEHSLTRDFTIIAQWIRDLAEPSSASGTAAA